jgi:FkbM family methyltransferase
MIIPLHLIQNIATQLKINIRGIFHVGAHECQELQEYINSGIPEENIVWVEGNDEIVEKMRGKGVKNIVNALVSDTESQVMFNITNNGQSSSILNLGTHKDHYPHIVVSKTETKTTKTVKQIQEENSLDFSNLNFWNFDIQGAELRALKGSGDLIKFADILYLEVNTEKVYEDGALINEIDEYVSAFGFRRVLISMTEQGWGDAVYYKVA